MDPRPTGNIFQAVHQKIAEQKEKMHKAQQHTARVGDKKANEEARLQGFDRSSASPIVPNEEV